MTEAKPGFIAQIKSYPATFWVANTMEIFERLAWYGWFTVMPVYVTGSIAAGGLGFSEETRGMLQGIVPCILYLLPVLTGALADRYGFKRMFIIAYLMMIASYYLLGQFTSVPAFFAAFLFVAVGAAVFKPVVVGTVARVTDSSNSATAFGIFYMMVNIGGFVGPVVAGLVRGWGWQYVFIACSTWAAINLVLVIALYREPERKEEDVRTLRKVMDDLVEVLGNLRFFITVGMCILGLMVAQILDSMEVEWFSWKWALIILAGWVVGNLLVDLILPARVAPSDAVVSVRRNPLLKRMHCSNWRFALFLLIMSGFWTSFNQIFYTMPGYIRDFVETRPLLDLAESMFGKKKTEDPNEGIASSLATINEDERAEIRRVVSELMEDPTRMSAEESLVEASKTLLLSKVRLAPEDMKGILLSKADDLDAATDEIMIRGRQMNPEFIVNVDAGAIVIFQVLVSFLMARFHRFSTMIIGMVIAAVGIGLSAFAGGEGFVGSGASVWIVAAGIFTFAFGEMMASPTSQEYVGRIAPPEKVALYMGYYFVAVALGNLFGGILSGSLYGHFARDMQRPDIMWAIFGGIMLSTAFIFLLYDRFALPRSRSGDMAGNVGG